MVPKDLSDAAPAGATAAPQGTTAAELLAAVGPGWELRDCERMLTAVEDWGLAKDKLLEAAEWRETTLAPWREQTEAQMPACETRVVAVGPHGRPLVYTGAVHQQEGEDGGALLACAWDRAIKEADEIRKDCAQVDYVLDALGFQMLLNMNPMPYVHVAGGMDSYYAERFHRIIILDMGMGMSWLWEIIKPLLPERTAAKIFFLGRDDDLTPLYELCDEPTKGVVAELLAMNAEATPETGRARSHELTNKHLEGQRAATGHRHALSTAPELMQKVMQVAVDDGLD